VIRLAGRGRFQDFAVSEGLHGEDKPAFPPALVGPQRGPIVSDPRRDRASVMP
jgi:hypothetical protein